MTRSRPKSGDPRHRTHGQGDDQRPVISRVQLSGIDQLVMSATAIRLDLRRIETSLAAVSSWRRSPASPYHVTALPS